MYQRIRKLLSFSEAKALCPSSGIDKSRFDGEIKKSIDGEGKFLIIVGPCSADNPAAVLFYCENLKRISERVSEKIFIVPRVYTTKPRSAAGAYRGMLHSPDCKTENINEGILTARKLMVDIAEKFGFFAADEMLYPELYSYFDDVLSYVTIGARSSEDQLHRMFASCLDIAVGIKNPMHGDLKSLSKAIKIAYTHNDFAFNGYEISSTGNKSAHAVLRGFTDDKGVMHSNCTREYIDYFVDECGKSDVNPAVIVDCNHFNSGKDYLLEPKIAMSALDLVSKGYDKVIKGLMIESYILDGKQNEPLKFGQSLTDGCLGLEKTERLIYDIADRLN